MASNYNILHSIKETQERIFRIALRNGLTLKAISLDSGIPYSTLRSYAGNNGAIVEMPVSALSKLIGVIPADLLSLLLPAGHVIVRAPEEIDHDQIADAMSDYLAVKHHAHHPDSPAGRDIADCEHEDLTRKFTVVAGGLAA